MHHILAKTMRSIITVESTDRRRKLGEIYTIDELRSIIAPILKKYGMVSASLFGSYARGQADTDSDIDVILFGKPGFRALDVFGVAEDLHRQTGKNVDVYEQSELKPGPFRDNVMREAIAL